MDPASSSSSEANVNKFVPKLDAKEQAKMNAMMSNLRDNAQSTIVTNEKDETRTLDMKAAGETSEGGIDLKAIPTVYFKGCHNSHYTIPERSTKVFIEDCHNCSFKFEKPILTSTLEAWRCNNVRISSLSLIKSYQLDLSRGIKLVLPSLSDFGMCVWNDLEDLQLEFIDTPTHNLLTGFTQMKVVEPDSNQTIDQFILRNIEGALKHERCIRLTNGFLSTEREAIEWEKKNELLKARFVENFLKEGGIRINKKPEKKIPPNDPCPCNSGQKYKKCCLNKKVLTGVEGAVSAKLYSKTN